MRTAALLIFLATSTHADEVVCAPRGDLAAALSDKWGETEIFTGAGQNGAVIAIYGRIDGTWTAVVVAPDGTACPVASGGAWQGFMIPQGEAG